MGHVVGDGKMWVLAVLLIKSTDRFGKSRTVKQVRVSNFHFALFSVFREDCQILPIGGFGVRKLGGSRELPIK